MREFIGRTLGRTPQVRMTRGPGYSARLAAPDRPSRVLGRGHRSDRTNADLPFRASRFAALISGFRASLAGHPGEHVEHGQHRDVVAEPCLRPEGFEVVVVRAVVGGAPGVQWQPELDAVGRELLCDDRVEDRSGGRASDASAATGRRL